MHSSGITYLTYWNLIFMCSYDISFFNILVQILIGNYLFNIYIGHIDGLAICVLKSQSNKMMSLYVLYFMKRRFHPKRTVFV